MVKKQDEVKIVEIIPLFTPDFEANTKQTSTAMYIEIYTKHLDSGAENLYQVIM
jgi:hypothetical protein